MPDMPGPDDPMISDEDKKTSEQREGERAERLEGLKKFLDPILEQRYQEGYMPFDLPRDQVLHRAEERILPKIESVGAEINPEFLSDVQSVIDIMNSVKGDHYTLNSTSFLVISSHLIHAAGEPDSDEVPDLSDVAFLAGEMDKLLRAASGQSLAEWAKAYVENHKDRHWKQYAMEYLNSLSALVVLADDESQYRYELHNLVRALSQDAKNQEIRKLDPNSALSILFNRGFIVPSEWKEEFSETWDGKELLLAIDKANSRLLLDNITDALEATYSDLPTDELGKLTLNADEILVAVSTSVEVPATWAECDDSTRKAVSEAMKKLVIKLKGKLGKSKGMPVIKFESK